MSEKGKNPHERSKGGPRRTQMEKAQRGERELPDEDDSEQAQESLREQERKPNRP